MVCGFQCAGCLLSKGTLSLTSLDLSESVVGRMISWRDKVSLFLFCICSLIMFSTGALGPVPILFPSKGTPAGNSSKIWVLTLFQCPKGSWVPGMCAWAQEKHINDSSNQASQIPCRSCWATLHRPASPVLPRFEAKEWSQSLQRYQSFCLFVCLFKFYFIFNFTILYWFCHISKWIHHRHTCVPHPELSSLPTPHTILLGHPIAPAPSIQYRAWNLDWWLVLYMILYIFKCHSSKSSHPLPLPQSPKECSIHQCLFCCLVYRVYDGMSYISEVKGSWRDTHCG